MIKKYVNASEFCRHTGFPYRYIRDLCRSGEIPCLRRGKTFILNEDETNMVIKDMMAAEAAERRSSITFKPPRKRRTSRTRFRTSAEFLAAIDAL